MDAATQPLISVVMATYNGAEYLSEQLDSLLSQTYPNMEIVICDDASTDGTSTYVYIITKKIWGISATSSVPSPFLPAHS
jgi:glycosyltransferase involved in cell wall biosynthesis